MQIQDNSMHIQSLYGQNIHFGEITHIHLIESSMSDIGIGSRAGGIDSAGETLKGNFKSTASGDMLLFVRPASSPTIRIERSNDKDVYLSFSDSNKTKRIYQQMRELIP